MAEWVRSSANVFALALNLVRPVRTSIAVPGNCLGACNEKSTLKPILIKSTDKQIVFIFEPKSDLIRPLSTIRSNSFEANRGLPKG